jgi:putative peptidoglycan lipid II flippase
MARNRQMAKTAGMISLLTMLSRVGGYIRDGLGGALLGAGLINDAYLAAFRIPNLLRDLFAEGALSSAFIPTFTQTTVQAGREQAWRLVSIVINAVLLLMLLIIGLGELFTPQLVHVIVPGFADVPGKLDLTIRLTRILFPFLAFISLAAVFMGVLNSQEKFGLPAFAPVMFNLSMIVVGLVTMPFYGAVPEDQVVWWAWGAFLGGVLQFAIQVPGVWKLGFRWRPILDWKDPGFRRILRLMAPAILGLSVTQINLFVNTLLASYLPEGAVTTLYYGNRLMQLPLGVFGVAIATALLPLTSGHLARGEKQEFLDVLSYGLRLLFVITVPAAVGLIVLSTPINRLLFEYGRFGGEAVNAVALASIAYSTGLIAYAGVKVIVPTFYALDDPRTPLTATVLAVGVCLVLNLVFLRPFGYIGLAMATVIAAYVNFFYLIVRLRMRLGSLDGRRILNSFVRVCLASAAMGLVVWSGSQGWLPHGGAGLGRWELAAKVFGLILFGGAAYAAFAWFFKLPETAKLWGLVRAKVGLGGTSEPWVE